MNHIPPKFLGSFQEKQPFNTHISYSSSPNPFSIRNEDNNNELSSTNILNANFYTSLCSTKSLWESTMGISNGSLLECQSPFFCSAESPWQFATRIWNGNLLQLGSLLYLGSLWTEICCEQKSVVNRSLLRTRGYELSFQSLSVVLPKPLWTEFCCPNCRCFVHIVAVYWELRSTFRYSSCSSHFLFHM